MNCKYRSVMVERSTDWCGATCTTAGAAPFATLIRRSDGSAKDLALAD